MEPETAVANSDMDTLTFIDILYSNFPDFFMPNNNDSNSDPWIEQIPMKFENYADTCQYFADSDIFGQMYLNFKYTMAGQSDKQSNLTADSLNYLSQVCLTLFLSFFNPWFL